MKKELLDRAREAAVSASTASVSCILLCTSIMMMWLSYLCLAVVLPSTHSLRVCLYMCACDVYFT